MSVAKTVEITATSTKSFEDAVKKGISRVTKTIDNVRSVWIKDQKATIKNKEVAEYRVRLKVTFELK
jgi:flavin-binding protein dodecin